MGIKDLFDEYELRARVLPALLIIFPTVFSSFAWFPELRSLGGAILNIVVTLGILTLMARLSRNAGKRKEQQLFDKWNGKPTTTILRHNNSTLDSFTKKRYHEYLGKCVKGIVIPTPEEENANRDQADIVYESVTRWLREKTRDKSKFPLVFQENVHYGFCRNLWAMKRWGLSLSLIALILNIAGILIKYPGKLLSVTPEIGISFVVALIMVIVWIFSVNSELVRFAAEAYGRALLASCEEIQETA
jgi:hypothetical protein